MPSEFNWWHNNLPKCPHCSADFQVWDGDHPLDLNYDDGGQTTHECTSCGKEFVTVTHVKYVFSTAVSEEAASDEDWGPQEAAA